MRLATHLIVFAGTCLGMGYLVGRKLKAPVIIGLSSVGAAVVWPVLLMAFTVYEGRSYTPYGPSDPVDAPGLLVLSMLFVGVPAVFGISLLLVLVGIVIARTKKA
jgi:hypothetical protein